MWLHFFLDKILWSIYPCLSAPDTVFILPWIACLSTTSAALAAPVLTALSLLLALWALNTIPSLSLFPFGSGFPCRTALCLAPLAAHPALGYQPDLLGCNLLRPADIKWGSEANCCQIKAVPRQGKSCKIPAFSWWLFRVSEVFVMDFFGTLVWSRGKSRSRRNSERRLCQSVHTSCKSLSFFQVHV